ncbi:MAG TPA: SDR family NAD(P)-dependent oxidoreductase [Gammaproteobacteria bacterium]|nr:SDR family NAD(P)-dependent oxidoreductase [Gammaproteobacteria bacterium]HIK69709.1 SDR family NAD(P)-dependent oxidoreductase [Pseudomonadales bacterium]
MVRLADKLAFITGAGSGIGKASALPMTEEGASVMCTDVDVDAARAASPYSLQASRSVSILCLQAATLSF